MSRSLPGILLLLVLGLAGCATLPAPTRPAPPVTSRAAVTPAASPPPVVPSAPAIPPAPATPPAPAIAAQPATLTGSEESSTMFDNFTAFVVAVDGQAVAAGRQGWNTPLSLLPGPHRLRVGFNRGVFAAEAELPLSAYPGAVYQLKFATDAELFGKNSYCEFWIVDTATGESVTQPRRVALTRIEPEK